MDRILIRISSGCLAKIAATDGDNGNNKILIFLELLSLVMNYDNFTLEGNATSAKCKFCSEKTIISENIWHNIKLC